jgi:hypothetical protein
VEFSEFYFWYETDMRERRARAEMAAKMAAFEVSPKRLVVESPWSQLTSECQRFGHPPRLDN